MQNKRLTKAVFTLLAATLLQACGGGGGDSATPTNTLANTPTTPVSSDPKPLSVITELQPNIKNLSTDWPTGVTVGNDNTLTFVGSPQLAKGDIFVVNSTAYKVEGIGGTPSATQVIVSQPALNEVYKKVEFSGKSDALEFIPNPELGLQPVAVAPENKGFQLGLGIEPTNVKSKLTLSKNGDGFYTAKYAVEKGFKGFSVKGALTVGAKAEVSQWDVISNKGHGQFDIFVEPSLLVTLLQSKNTLVDTKGICSSKSDLRGPSYILLGTIPMSKALAAVPVVGVLLTSTMSMNIPVCLSMNASTDMRFDLLELSGKFQVSILVGNQQAPHFNNTQNLLVSAPAASATLSEATLFRQRYTSKVEGEMALETGLEAGDNLGFVNVGATVAAVIKASLQGDFGVSVLYKSLRGVITEPDACLTLKGEGVIRAKGQTSAFWSKDPLSVATEIPLEKIPDAKFGLCVNLPSGYTKISATGEKLPNSATEWSCVLDNQTGLMWEKKTDDGGLRDKDHEYSWFEDSSGYADTRDYLVPENGYNTVPSHAEPYGYICNNTLAKCNTKAYAQAVNTKKLCGYSNWRLGTREELVVIAQKQDKASFFEGYYYNDYGWSSSPYGGSWIWIVDFYSGNDNHDYKGSSRYVRLVRSSQ